MNFIKTKARIIFVTLLGIAVLVFVGQKTVFKPKQVAIQTEKIARGTIISSLSVSGQIAATNRMSVITQATGQVSQVNVADGDMVVAGQKILELVLDQSGQQKFASARSSYLSAESTLAAAQASLYSLQSTMFSKWKTYTDLATNSTYQNSDGTPNTTNRILTQFTTVQDDWYAAEAAYKNQQGVIVQAQAAVVNAWNSYQMLSSVVVAPMSGRITDMTYVAGMMFAGPSDTTSNPSQKIASITSDALAAATFALSEADVVGVKRGQRVTMTLDAFPGKTFTGSVVGVNRSGVTTSGVTTYPATVQFDTTPPELSPNMSVTANIIRATKENVLLVRSGAIRQQGSTPTVRILVHGKTQEVPVETGLTSDTETEIISGVNEGDTVVTGGGTTTTTSNGSSPFGVRFGGFGGGGALRPGGR